MRFTKALSKPLPKGEAGRASFNFPPTHTGTFSLYNCLENGKDMKRVIVFLGWMLAGITTVSAQDYTRVYKVANRTAFDIYVLAAEFVAGRNFTYSKDPVNNSVEIDVVIPYTGSSSDCMAGLDLNGKLFLQAKDGKTRIIMDSITYTQHKLQVADTPVIMAAALHTNDTACAASGQVEALYKCAACSQRTDKVKAALQSYFDQLADSYRDYMKSEILTSGL